LTPSEVGKTLPSTTCRFSTVFLAHLEVGARVLAALLEDEHAEAGALKLRGGDRAAGAGADDDDVGLEPRAVGERGSVDEGAGSAGRAQREAHVGTTSCGGPG
jgi:hypothetical protein